MSLVEITGAGNAVIILHPDDDVAIARLPLSPGQEIRSNSGVLTVREVIPPGHKVALRAIQPRHEVLRYGQVIGRAALPIAPGEHVHTHNLSFEEVALRYEFPETETSLPQPPAECPTFLGYPRPDGRMGTRNYIAVVAASNCAAHTADLVARSFDAEALPPNVDGVAAFPHGEGCGHAIGPDTELLERTLSGVLDHPNVAAAVLIGLGCEVNQIAPYLGSSRVIGLTLQDSGGTRATVEAARREILRRMEQIAAEPRVPVPASKLVIGLNCGGSDSFSGITANPALGHASDLLTALGGTAVLAETPEIFGAEHLLVRRARNRQVAERLLAFVEKYKAYLRMFGENFDDNPSPGNKAGGLSNILEKSLGAVAKAGTSVMTDVVDYAERVRTPGFVFMNTPGYDPVSLSGLAAGGVNLIAFTTGRGSAIGFPTIPVLKIASNTATFRRMRDNMDINAGRIADGEATVDQIGREILDALLRCASGERTSAERLGHKEFVPWRIGPVM
ncbi:MAG TPA: altronate dehydratase family protein [Bryobacteraceae bacterium]|nr:altronate dehydratase family protein [Bryobacteraceae bacterium]